MMIIKSNALGTDTEHRGVNQTAVRWTSLYRCFSSCFLLMDSSAKDSDWSLMLLNENRSNKALRKHPQKILLHKQISKNK